MFFCNLSTKNNSCLKSVEKEKELTLKHIQINQYSSIEVMVCKNCLKDFPGLLDEPVKPLGLFKGTKDYYNELINKPSSNNNLLRSEKTCLSKIIELIQDNGGKMYTAQIAKELEISPSLVLYHYNTNKNILNKYVHKTMSGNRTMISLINPESTTKQTKKALMIKLLEERKSLTTSEMATLLNTESSLVTAMVSYNKDIFSSYPKRKENKTSGRGGHYENVISLREDYKESLKQKKVYLKRI